MKIGVVNRFSAPKFNSHPSGYRIGDAFTQLGVEWVPLELRECMLNTQKGKPSLSFNGINLENLNLNAVLWRVSENDTLNYTPILTALAQQHILVNPLETILLCSSKWDTYLCLAEKNIPSVPTTFHPQGSTLPEPSIPTVIKPNYGAGGKGVQILQGAGIAEHATLMQPIFGEGKTHRRVLVCNGKAVTSLVRTPTSGNFANNLTVGGSAVEVPLGKEGEVAEMAARAVGGVVVGVDLVPTREQNWLVLEINSCPGIEGFPGMEVPTKIALTTLQYAVTHKNKHESKNKPPERTQP